MTKEEKIQAFDPNGMATGDQLFGLPFNEEESEIIILPVPWEVTVSYIAGTANAPKAIAAASRQVDLYDGDDPDGWKRGIFLKKSDKNLQKKGKQLRNIASQYLDLLEQGEETKAMRKMLKQVNEAGDKLREWVRTETLALLQKGKLVGLLGGDHSTPLGFLEALAHVHPEFGILQIDAHCDLRNSYEGFTYSHASIMFNALKIPQVNKLVQVGIRDYCEEEANVIRNSEGRVKAFFDADMKREMYEGKSWKHICEKIIGALPQQVYISFDIDGLDPKLCPSTGTPVAGGLEFEQAVYLLLSVVRSGRKIIGFDLNEVVPGKTEWDANVAARLLFKLCNLMGLSNDGISASPEEEFPRNDEEVMDLKHHAETLFRKEEEKEESD
jgi:agmatinase